MSVKKIVYTATGAVALGLSLSATPAMAVTTPGVYAHVDLGYAATNWSAAIANTSANSNAKGGFAYGLDLGYQFNRFLAAELGGFGFTNASFTPAVPAAAGQVTAKEWLGYLAAKLSVPVMDAFDLYVKAGADYRGVKFSGASASRSGVWGAIFGVGAEYNYDNWLFNVQYLNAPSSNMTITPTGAAAGTSFTVPVANIYTVGIGYSFAM